MKHKKESGVVVVEAAIVVTVVTMFIAVMLYICMVLYQQSLVNIMANQTASNIAQIYGNTLRDPFTGYVDADGVHETVTYTNLRNQAYMDVIEQKADVAALYRLKSSRILTTGNTEVEVNIVPKKNELLKDQIVVTVSDTYEIPLVSFFGAGNNKLTFTGTGRADCTDLLEYLIGVPAMGTTNGNAVIFSSEECTVNFYKYHGDSRPLKTMTVLRGNSVNSSTDYSHSVMPSNPTQEKMRFTKWITEDGRTFTGDSIVNENMNIYGNWECTITFDPDGGKLVNLNPPTKIATVFQNVELPVATRNKCTFDGWYTEKNGEGERFTGLNIQGDITVYAKWICTVTFNPDGGSVSHSSFDVIYGKNAKIFGKSFPVPNRAGCSFSGWYTQRFGNGTKYTDNTTINGHVTVYAKWNCAITLMGNGGKVENKNSVNKNVVVGKKLKLPVPIRGKSNTGKDGWRFNLWNTNINGSGNIYNKEITVDGPLTLYAIWSCVHKDSQGNSRYNLGERKLYLCGDNNGGSPGSQKSYQAYNCIDCGYQIREYISNKHYIDPDYLIIETEYVVKNPHVNYFTGHCSVNHKQRGSYGDSGMYDSGFGQAYISYSWHITCRYCGMPTPKVFYENINGSEDYKDIFWVGSNPPGTLTECWYPNLRN